MYGYGVTGPERPPSDHHDNDNDDYDYLEMGVGGGNHDELTPYTDSAAAALSDRPTASVLAERKNYERFLGNMADFYQIFDHDMERAHETAEFIFGPEQAAVLAREAAQAAAPCCPRGFMEGSVRRAALDKLLDMEEEAVDQLDTAIAELKMARYRATLSIAEKSGSMHPKKASAKAASPAEAAEGSPESQEQKDEEDEEEPQTQQQQQDAGRPTLHRSASLPVELPRGMSMLETELIRKASTVSDHNPTANGGVSGRSILHVSQAAAQEPPAPKSSRAKTPQASRWSQVEAIVLEASEGKVKKVSTGNLQVGGGGAGVGGDAGGYGVVGCCSSGGSGRRGGVGVAVVATQAAAKAGVGVAKVGLNVTKHVVERANQLLDDAVRESTGLVTDVVTHVARESTYAVVTFTSRQAAVAARHCLADGRGTKRWETLPDAPIPPLPDAAAWDVLAFRSFCRPLALSINDRQKSYRNYVYVCLCVCLFGGVCAKRWGGRGAGRGEGKLCACV